jgi:hypothetical protein
MRFILAPRFLFLPVSMSTRSYGQAHPKGRKSEMTSRKTSWILFGSEES